MRHTAENATQMVAAFFLPRKPLCEETHTIDPRKGGYKYLFSKFRALVAYQTLTLFNCSRVASLQECNLVCEALSRQADVEKWFYVRACLLVSPPPIHCSLYEGNRWPSPIRHDRALPIMGSNRGLTNPNMCNRGRSKLTHLIGKFMGVCVCFFLLCFYYKLYVSLSSFVRSSYQLHSFQCGKKIVPADKEKKIPMQEPGPG